MFWMAFQLFLNVRQPSRSLSLLLSAFNVYAFQLASFVLWNIRFVFKTSLHLCFQLSHSLCTSSIAASSRCLKWLLLLYPYARFHVPRTLLLILLSPLLLINNRGKQNEILLLRVMHLMTPSFFIFHSSSVINSHLWNFFLRFGGKISDICFHPVSWLQFFCFHLHFLIFYCNFLMINFTSLIFFFLGFFFLFYFSLQQLPSMCLCFVCLCFNVCLISPFSLTMAF